MACVREVKFNNSQSQLNLQLMEETPGEIATRKNLGPAKVVSVSKSFSKPENYSPGRRAALRREEDPGTFFTGLIFLIFLESCRYAGTVRRKLQSSIGELSTGCSGYAMGQGGRVGGRVGGRAFVTEPTAVFLR